MLVLFDLLALHLYYILYFILWSTSLNCLPNQKSQIQLHSLSDHTRIKATHLEAVSVLLASFFLCLKRNKWLKWLMARENSCRLVSCRSANQLCDKLLQLAFFWIMYSLSIEPAPLVHLKPKRKKKTRVFSNQCPGLLNHKHSKINRRLSAFTFWLLLGAVNPKAVPNDEGD